jgi:hypothetical protein
MYVEGYTKVRVWVPDRAPGAPDQGLPPEVPGYPDQGLPGFPEYPGQPLPRPPWTPRPPDPWLPEFPPGIGGGPIIPGFPERPGQGLPIPPRVSYPVVDDPDGLGGHPLVPDLNMTRRIRISAGDDQFTGYVLLADPPQVEDDYEPRLPPESWRPGKWLVVLYGTALAWAWVREIGAESEGEPGQGLPGDPEREPKAY